MQLDMTALSPEQLRALNYNNLEKSQLDLMNPAAVAFLANRITKNISRWK